MMPYNLLSEREQYEALRNEALTLSWQLNQESGEKHLDEVKRFAFLHLRNLTLKNEVKPQLICIYKSDDLVVVSNLLRNIANIVEEEYLKNFQTTMPVYVEKVFSEWN